MKCSNKLIRERVQSSPHFSISNAMLSLLHRRYWIEGIHAATFVLISVSNLILEKCEQPLYNVRCQSFVSFSWSLKMESVKGTLPDHIKSHTELFGSLDWTGSSRRERWLINRIVPPIIHCSAGSVWHRILEPAACLRDQVNDESPCWWCT